HAAAFGFGQGGGKNYETATISAGAGTGCDEVICSLDDCLVDQIGVIVQEQTAIGADIVNIGHGSTISRRLGAPTGNASTRVAARNMCPVGFFQAEQQAVIAA